MKGLSLRLPSVPDQKLKAFKMQREMQRSQNIIRSFTHERPQKTQEVSFQDQRGRSTKPSNHQFSLNAECPLQRSPQVQSLVAEQVRQTLKRIQSYETAM